MKTAATATVIPFLNNPYRAHGSISHLERKLGPALGRGVVKLNFPSKQASKQTHMQNKIAGVYGFGKEKRKKKRRIEEKKVLYSVVNRK